jgi:hypothetical protein
MRLHAGLSAIAVVLLSSVAGAQELTGSHPRSFESPQHFAFELRFSPYTPNIDSAPGLTGKPYETTFGTTPRVLPAIEFDWQALRIPHFGTIGPALSAGYTVMGASATFAAGGGASAESTNLEVFPFYGVGVLRVDVFERDFGIPLVPYAKGGVGVALWRAYNDSGTSVGTNGVSGKGSTWGSHFAFGLGLSLNWIDRRSSKNLDGATGINDTMLFAEWMFMNLDGFGAADKLRVGTSTWVVGLALQF